jgi:hypothetical protein
VSNKYAVKKYRDSLRAQGLRRVQVWAPDTRTEAFKREAHRQSLIVAKDRDLAHDDSE